MHDGWLTRTSHMAADEMRTITSDKWSDDVWGVSSPSATKTASNLAPPAQLFFYFGRDDHWVAERTREEIVTSRGSGNEEEGKGPRMVVCEEAVPHAFCLSMFLFRLALLPCLF
jgi:hypothetical protein